ncbi:hypothetical protein F5Y16DRAFT_398883 [Xylariaceae sp. FL0255]|nr:hypothetical protein F5Y16DRAFT_398883 [Xylariaceae sp. FL0255]
MDTFPHFASLPVKRRLLIWREAAHAEADSRLVITVRYRVGPFESLKNSLLSVNEEYRDFDLNFFFTPKLDVYRMPAASDIDMNGRWYDVFEDIEVWATMESSVFVSLAALEISSLIIRDFISHEEMGVAMQLYFGRY